jgi:hypothetical protein
MPSLTNTAIRDEVRDLAEKLGGKLDCVDKKIGGLKESVAIIQTRCGYCREKVEEHAAVLDGTNGMKGMKTRVAVLERARAARAALGSTMLTVAGAILGALATIVGQAIAGR